MKKILAGIATLLLASTAQAAVITIDFNNIGNLGTYTEDGFTFTVLNNSNHTDGGSYLYVHGGYGASGTVDYDTALRVTYAGKAFSLVSFDFMYGVGAGVVGNDGTVVNFADKTNFSAATTNIGLNNVTSAVFRITRSANPGNAIGFDNLRIENAPVSVPEPASVALLGAAMAGLALARRRKPQQ